MNLGHPDFRLAAIPMITTILQISPRPPQCVEDGLVEVRQIADHLAIHRRIARNGMEKP
mgnify:CR=1 FL=1